MNDLVRKLSQGDHPVEASVRPEKNLTAFKSALERGYIHIRFTGTKGETELGFKLDKDRSDLSGGNLETQSGHIKICGDLTLDYERVRCVADIDLQTLEGQGHLEILSEARA